MPYPTEVDGTRRKRAEWTVTISASPPMTLNAKAICLPRLAATLPSAVVPTSTPTGDTSEKTSIARAYQPERAGYVCYGTVSHHVSPHQPPNHVTGTSALHRQHAKSAV